MITITYKNGSLRLIHPHASFYQPTVGPVNGKDVNLSIRNKLDMMAHDFGHDPYIISLARADKEIERIKIDWNAPAESAPVESKEQRHKARKDRLSVIKQFKKETNEQVYTFHKKFTF